MFDSTEKNKIVIFNLIEARKVKKSKRHLINFMIGPGIFFIDDHWDFNYRNTKNRERSAYKFNFSSIEENFKFYLKVLVLRELVQKRNAFNSAQKVFNEVRTITNAFINKNITDVALISKRRMEQYFNQLFEKGRQHSYIGKLARHFKRYIKIVVEYDGIEASELIRYLGNLASECEKHRGEKSANEYIPDQFLNQIVSFAMKDINDENLPVKERMFACMLVIIAETGMRREELSLLETGNLDTRGFDNKEVFYLKFLTFKTTNYKVEGIETICYLTEIAAKAYKTCEKLVEDTINELSPNTKDKLIYYYHTGKNVKGRYLSVEQKKVVEGLSNAQLKEYDKRAKKYLYISTKYGFQIMSKHTLTERLEQFMIRHNEEFNLDELSEDDRAKIDNFKIGSKSRYNKYFNKSQRGKYPYEVVKNIEYPYVNFHRFRVTVCTKLFRQGVHLDFIMKHMNHISEDMTLYYNKSEDLDNDLEENLKLFSEITNEEGLMETNVENINDDFWKSELANKDVNRKIESINEFLKKNKLNIKNDLGKILKILRKQNTIVAENEFGICIRSLLQGVCERKKYFSSMTDNYFIGIQLNTYKFLPHNYTRFKKKKEIINHNFEIAKKDPQYQNEYEREVKSLKWFVKNKINKEIEFLETDLVNKTRLDIIKNNPDLEEIINNLNIIKEEIQEWMN